MAQDRRIISKRRFPRRKFHQKVGLLYHGKYEISQSFQIGEGGMMVKPPAQLQEGDQLVLSFMVPGRVFIVVRAQVQYTVKDPKGNMYGVKFLNITFDNRRKLRDFVAAKTEEEARQEGVFN